MSYPGTFGWAGFDNRESKPLREGFILCGGIAILCAACLQLVMFIRLSRRKDFGPLWESDLFSNKDHNAGDRILLKIGIFGEEMKAYFLTLVGRCHLFLFVAFALAAAAFGIATAHEVSVG